MARSPTRRDDDRYVRDRRDDRSHRRRSRSRDRDGRYDDRDHYRRRDRSYERYEEHRGSRRDRSMDRKRSRNASPVRDRRGERDRYRDDGTYYDDRDRKRPRREEESSRHPRRGASRDRRNGPSGSTRDTESARPPTAGSDPEAAKKTKLAKVEAWKRNMEEKKRKEAEVQGVASPLLKADNTSTAAGSPAGMSPDADSRASTAPGSPATPTVAETLAATMPYAGKFDPKAIARRAAAAMEKQRAALGGDVVIPKSATETSNANGARMANNSKAAPSNLVNGTSSVASANAKISGFGLNKSNTERSDKSSTLKTAAPLEDEEEVERRLEKLPDVSLQVDARGTALADEADDQDDGDDMRSDEEEASAAREAAQKRAEAAQSEQTEIQDVDMADTNAAHTASGSEPQAVTAAASAYEVDAAEEIDPLDAFMNDLEKPADNLPNLATGNAKQKQTLVFNGDDDEADLDAVGDNADDFLALAAKRKKKEIPAVNHAKMQYEVVRKNFYAESVELSEMTPEEVDVLRAELDNITCRGSNPPKPMVKWSQGGFGAQILDVIREQKFEKPTPIQSQALPAIMSGRDVIGIAKTGSGKTVAFILPMFRHIKDQRPLDSLDGPIGLILAPTRELATQIHRECKPYLKALNLRAVCAYGGTPIKDQIAELKRGAEVVVCTPGRMIDLLAANSGRVTNLRRVTYVVLDEADRMFDMGFEPQITKILTNIRPQRQTVLFSATFPRNMEALARKVLTKPIEINVGGRSTVAPEVTQHIEVRTEDTKFRRLLELLGGLHDKDEDARSLIFVERQETADTMLKDLLKKQYPCVSIHGGREQIDRDEAIIDFKAGVVPVMIATSVAARGLDVKQLKLVVNYDSPNHGEDYVHRVGRTGRAGNTGDAYTFVTPEQDRYAPFLIKVLSDSGQEIPESLRDLKDAHDQKVKAGDAKKIGSGFGGRGIERLEAARDAERASQRKQYRTGEEPDEEEEDGDKKTESKESKVEELVAKAAGSIKDRETQAQQQNTEAAAAIPTALSAHLSNAMKVQKAEIPPPTSKSTNDPLAKVSAAVANINSRLGARGSTRPGVPIDNRGPDAGAFHATLEINDFPQKARWAVTNRTNVAKILEATGTSITSKGNYYPPGKDPEAGGMPKLYILVEGDTEVQVETAMRELTRLLKEGTIAALDATARAPASGRYSVV